MFCYQCEQTAKGSGCTSNGVCGKSPHVSDAQDKLTIELIELAQAAKENPSKKVVDLIVDGLFITMTNVNFDIECVEAYTELISTELAGLGGGTGGAAALKPEALFEGGSDAASLRATLLFGLKGMAAYMHHARILGRRDETADRQLVSLLAAAGGGHSTSDWLALALESGKVNLSVLALLDAANTGVFGAPTPVTVPLKIEKGPFIVVSGHDLHDLKMLLEQSAGTGVNIYTHCEMLPAHAYPELKKHPHLKGHFGTAWQNQQKEFDAIPAPVLFTTNCIMPPKASYTDCVYTTSVVGFPGIRHTGEDGTGRKDFSALICHAKKLGGWAEDKQLHGINGGVTVTTGYGRETVLANAGALVEAVKSGAVKHFFLVGGCDGAKAGRNYYTDFVKQTPKDSLILTLACGKFRFNDMDLGSIGGFPRILDMGQCNDAYGAIQVAIALSQAFSCGVNDLPLTLVLSWYEQKAVCILLSLLALGIKNIYLGPSIPAFLSEPVVKVLVEQFNLHPVSTPKDDLKAILGN
ncbi:MAG: hydroxylamine reductase [Spirochaetaceae bacterium]|jgi:hydroxylamine reductase|nr:hydroxylamine reductase [Spirochaetaceae bacterium]